MSKHTPLKAGPELIQALQSYGYSQDRIDQIVRAVNSHEDMLDVLKRAKRVVAESCGYNDGVRFHVDLLNDIEAAIAQAEGGKP